MTSVLKRFSDPETENAFLRAERLQRGPAIRALIVIALVTLFSYILLNPVYFPREGVTAYAAAAGVLIGLLSGFFLLTRTEYYLDRPWIDLPVFVTSPLYRRWHLRWGATDTEVRAAMDGDELLPRATYVATRAITIDAPIERVWPWLVQVGRGRAGFYSDDLLDNGAKPSAQQIDERWQHLEIGQWVPMAEKITPRTAFRVAEIRAPYELLWRKPDSTWAWTLTRTEDGGTRLVTRIRAAHDRRHWTRWLCSVLLLEVGDYPMQRRMLLHLRARAERTSDVRASAAGT
jgi:hypothetical protein